MFQTCRPVLKSFPPPTNFVGYPFKQNFGEGHLCTYFYLKHNLISENTRTNTGSESEECGTNTAQF